VSDEVHRHRVDAEAAGTRLDRFLADRHPGRSRAQLASLCREGLVRIDGRPARPSAPVPEGAEVEVRLPEAPTAALEPEPIPLDILHEDEDVLVLNKPADLVVHPGAGIRHGTLAAALVHHDPGLAGVGGEGRSGIVHRLDRGTSGLMVIARHGEAHRALARQFKDRTVEKIYDAIVWGRPPQAEGEIDQPIGRHPTQRWKMATGVVQGREAVSRYRVLETVPGFARLAIRILTGRTHQVRVHMAAIGFPLVGDLTYAGDRSRSLVDPRRRQAVRALERPALHARRLVFTHPARGEPMAFSVPWPADMVRLWRELGGREA
jgi:23S rRNA pseudouridine1911/1915/1917 synthase